MDKPKPKDVQFCPRCLSTNIKVTDISNVGNPIEAQGVVGWECLECGYIGIDFFIADEEEYEEIKKDKEAKKRYD